VTTVGSMLKSGRARLAAVADPEQPGAPSAREALLLLSQLLGRGEAQILAHDEDPVPAALAARFANLIERRVTGEPVAYLLGEKEFWGRPFAVDSRVLVPRPDTEHLLEAALGVPLPPGPWILDLGTGSGALAVTLALELPGSHVVAIDRSPGALAVASHNARDLGSPVRLLASDWTAALRLERFDLLVSNPPYLDPADPEVAADVAAWEPDAALWAGERGLDAYRRLLVEAAGVRPGTPLLLELGAGQLAAVSALAEEAGWTVVGDRPDYAGIPRVLSLRR
jgi:release factor glutamine methyltransferase